MHDPLHVLHVITGLAPTGGGPPVALEGLTLAQRRAGVRVTVAATFREGDDCSRVERLRLAGAEVIMLGPSMGRLQRVPEMRATLQRLVQQDNGPEVIHIHNLWENVQHQAAWVAREAGIPYIIRPCGMLDPWSLRQSATVKRLMLAFRTKRDLRGAAAVHYTTDTERDLAAPLRLNTRAIVEPNGVTMPEPHAPSGASGREAGSTEGLSVVYLSRLHPKKAPDVLLDAFDRVTQRWPQGKPLPSLTLAGPDEGGTQATLEAQLAGLGCRDRVRFAGLVEGEAKSQLLREADLFCLPSHQENFGIAVVEALAAGTPVLISDQVNIYEEVTAAGVGEATPVDAEAFAEAMGRWLLDDGLRTAAAAKASAFAADRYDWDAIAARWTGHYASLGASR